MSTLPFLVLLCVLPELIHAFYFSSTLYSFDGAQAYCESECQSNLAVMQSSNQFQQAIVDMTADTAWVGLQLDADRREWFWNDGAVFNQSILQMSNYSNMSCALLTSSYSLHSAVCAEQHPFLCESCVNGTVSLTQPDGKTHPLEQSIRLSIKELIIILVFVAVAVMFSFCAVCGCVFYVNKLAMHYRSSSVCDEVVPSRSQSHMPQQPTLTLSTRVSSVDISSNDKVLFSAAAETKNVLQMEECVNENCLIPESDLMRLRLRVSAGSQRTDRHSNALYDQYVTRNGRPVRVMAMPPSPASASTQQEGVVRVAARSVHSDLIHLNVHQPTERHMLMEESLNVNLGAQATIRRPNENGSPPETNGNLVKPLRVYM